MNEIVLAGCTPTPLASYLKALGVLRLLSAKYPDTRGFWRNETFVLHASFDRVGIEQFFLDIYEPTPIMAPWNGGSGFYKKDNKTALNAIQESNSPRFANYRTCLDIAEQALNGMDRDASPKGDDKAVLLTRIRNLLPDDALGWFDASISLASASAQYPPLLGTGGNDGRLDFTNNFMQRLLDVIPQEKETGYMASRQWLAMTLFSEAAPGLAKNAIGQFSPGQAGGPNASTGFDADAAINPWDFVLMIEGALAFASAVVRRHADDPFGVMSYPFTVRAVSAGSGSLGEGDTTNARGELWMPLWQQPTTYREVRALMAEGRVALGKKPARDALDFVRALHHLGGYRGVQSFQRFGLLMRSGKAYLATPLSRIEVSEQPAPRWLDELDKYGWLDRFRQFTRSDTAANRFHVLRRRLEDMLFVSGQKPAKADVQALLTLLGEIQFALSSSHRAMESVPPVPRLSDRWVQTADDGSPAFRIAKALAGTGGKILPLRAQLFPVQRKLDRWISQEAGERVRIHTPVQGRLPEKLCAFLQRRLWLAEKLEFQDKPLAGPAGVALDDMAAFLRDDRMDTRIAALLSGLALCTIPDDVDKSAGNGALPAAFALLKLVLTPDRTLRSLGWLADTEHMPIPVGMVARLVAGNDNQVNQTVQTAWRRLRTSGVAPLFDDAKNLPSLFCIDPQRAAAALLIPLRYGATGALARQILSLSEREPI